MNAVRTATAKRKPELVCAFREWRYHVAIVITTTNLEIYEIVEPTIVTRLTNRGTENEKEHGFERGRPVVGRPTVSRAIRDCPCAVPEPKERMSGRRIYDPQTVRRLAAHFDVQLPESEV